MAAEPAPLTDNDRYRLSWCCVCCMWCVCVFWSWVCARAAYRHRPLPPILVRLGGVVTVTSRCTINQHTNFNK
jgi:hypothetical protein